MCRAVVVAQLAEQSLPKVDVRGFNLVISIFYAEHFFTVDCTKDMKIKKKRQGRAHLLNTFFQ